MGDQTLHHIEFFDPSSSTELTEECRLNPMPLIANTEQGSWFMIRHLAIGIKRPEFRRLQHEPGTDNGIFDASLLCQQRVEGWLQRKGAAILSKVTWLTLRMLKYEHGRARIPEVDD